MTYFLDDPDKTKNVLGYEGLVSGFRRLSAYLDAVGLKVPASSRLQRYAETLELLQRPSSKVKEPVRAEALVTELVQLTGIVECLSHDSALPGRLRELFAGHSDALFAAHRDPARDFQFELYLAAALTSAAEEVQLAEPDVIATIGGRTIAFAAKRPRQASGLRKLVKKGGHQIRNANCDGFVAADLSLCPLEGSIMVSMVEHAEEVQSVAHGYLLQFLSEQKDHLRNLVTKAPEPVLGLLLFLSVPVAVEGGVNWPRSPGRAWGLVIRRQSDHAMGIQLLMTLNGWERRRDELRHGRSPTPSVWPPRLPAKLQAIVLPPQGFGLPPEE